MPKPRRHAAHAAPPGAAPAARLEEAEARYRDLVESLPLTTYVAALDVQGSFRYISPQVEALLGYTPRQWLADPGIWLKRLHPQDRARMLAASARAHRAGAPFRAEYRLLDRSGRAHWIRDESRVVRDAAGRPLVVQGTWTEVTRHRELERDAAGKARELASVEDEVAQFLSVASHELGAPLRRIVNLAELLARASAGRLDAESARLLERVRESAVLAQELVAALVRLSEQGRPREAFRAVDVGEALTRALGELEEPAAAAGALVTRGPLPAVWAEPVLLERVLFNLLDNALKHRGREAPRVHVSAERSGRDWVVSVRDNGPGLDPRRAERLFSLGGPARPGAPAALGLAVSRKIVERLGGRLWVESQPGEGADFRFTLPAHEGAG